MSSTVVLLVIVVMDSSTRLLLLAFVLLFKWHVYGQDDSLLKQSVSVETQYLTFDMAQYGPEGGTFSSTFISVSSLRDGPRIVEFTGRNHCLNLHSKLCVIERSFRLGPNFPNYYPQDTILFYQFVAASDYRVQIDMDTFQIRGVTPQCTHDYLDVFINVSSFDLIHNFANDQLLHRYCGRNKPPKLVSFTNLLLLGFFTEDTLTERGFNGSFRFIPVQPYRNNLIRQPCDYLFNSSIAKRGELFSSTYPGTYLPVSTPPSSIPKHASDASSTRRSLV